MDLFDSAVGPDNESEAPVVQERTRINGSYCSFISVSMATVWRETGEETGEEDQGAAVWSLLYLIKASELSGGVQV